MREGEGWGMRDGEGWWGMAIEVQWGAWGAHAQTHRHMDTQTHEQEHGPWSSYLKMDLKNDFFDFFQPICFWKAETKLEMNLLEFLGSEVIWGRERSSKVKFEKQQNLDMLYVFGNLYR